MIPTRCVSCPTLGCDGLFLLKEEHIVTVVYCKECKTHYRVDYDEDYVLKLHEPKVQ